MKTARFVLIISLLAATDAYATPTIYAPWSCGDTYTITQGNRGAYSHKAGEKSEYAWDGGLPEGTTIVAPAAGTITHVKDNSNTTCSSSCSYANYVAMEFDEGNSATFYHLKYNSAKVKVGQHVDRGQPIALSGNTGWSTGPHLHFHVMKTCGSAWCQSIETPWAEVGRVPVKGDRITSKNCSYGVCEPTTEICDGKDNDCDGEIDEGELCENAKAMDVNFQGAVYDPQNTDINGDGKADICARGAAGLYCALSKGSGFENAKLILTELNNDNGWDDLTNYASLTLGDINGDGKADVCIRSNTRLLCWPSKGSSFGSQISGPEMPDKDFVYANQYTTHKLADINGDGKLDACARFADGFKCFPSTGSGFGSAITVSDMSDTASSGIWKKEKHYASIRMADINGDGKADVCGRTTEGMVCYPSKGTSFGAKINGPAWSDSTGWTDSMYFTSIRMPDINGDGKADFCARAARGIICSLSNGTSFGSEIDGPAWANTKGWNDYSNYATIQYADINGDGMDDVCGRANDYFLCYLSNGKGFSTKYTINDFSDADGWSEAYHFRSIRLGDINGDGKADVCGRGKNGVICYTFNGSGFTGPISGPNWPDSDGWYRVKYGTTFRMGGPATIPCTSRDEICDGKDNNCNGKIDENNVCCTPSEEICDGKDNDCNGQIDEGGVCCTPSEEICDGKDNDCDGKIDEDDVCTQEPECIPTQEICDGIDNDCDNEIDEDNVCCIPSEEICDGLDNDCDDQIDEDDVCQTAVTPGSDDIDDSENDNGSGSESDANSDNNISENPNADDETCVPKEEYCDGKDNDCDGQIDEDGVCDAGSMGEIPGEILEDDCSCSSTKTPAHTPHVPLLLALLTLLGSALLRKRS